MPLTRVRKHPKPEGLQSSWEHDLTGLRVAQTTQFSHANKKRGFLEGGFVRSPGQCPKVAVRWYLDGALSDRTEMIESKRLELSGLDRLNALLGPLAKLMSERQKLLLAGVADFEKVCYWQAIDRIADLWLAAGRGFEPEEF
jgi:hypothetical protein